MADLQDQMIKHADAQVRSMRSRMVHALADAHERLMISPSDERGSIAWDLVQKLETAATDESVASAVENYQTVSELSVDPDVQQEMSARAKELRGFSEAFEGASSYERPWLAGLSTTTAEVVRPELLEELRSTPSWRLTQQASLEAGVSCMPPDPAKWTAADRGGFQRIEAYKRDADVWRRQDYGPWETNETEELPAGGVLRDEVGKRLKQSCLRTDGNSLAVSDARARAELVLMEGTGATSNWWALNQGIPTDVDSFPAPNKSLQQEPDVTVTMTRPEWERARTYMGKEHDALTSVDDHSVQIVMGAQQLEELKDRTEITKWSAVSYAQKIHDRFLVRMEADEPAAEDRREVADIEAEAKQVVSKCDALTEALNNARSVPVHSAGQTVLGVKREQVYMTAGPRTVDASATVDMGR